MLELFVSSNMTCFHVLYTIFLRVMPADGRLGVIKTNMLVNNRSHSFSFSGCSGGIHPVSFVCSFDSFKADISYYLELLTEIGDHTAL